MQHVPDLDAMRRYPSSQSTTEAVACFTKDMLTTIHGVNLLSVRHFMNDERCTY